MTEKGSAAKAFDEEPVFDVAGRGYARDQVDTYIRAVASTVNALRARIDRLELQLSEEHTDVLADPASPRLIGAKVAELLRLAEAETADITAAAHADHDRILAQARKSAEAIIRCARADADAAGG